MIIKEQEVNSKVIKEVAEKMMIAARTAPKARGMDNLEIAMINGDDIKILADKMHEIGTNLNGASIIRDSENIRNCHAIVIIGTRIKSIGLQDKCGFCGYNNCDEKDKNPNHPCVYNTNDMGIAIGSAVSIAMDNRVDNRIMYSIGKAALELGHFSSDVKIALGIPLSATKKNPFFDR